MGDVYTEIRMERARQVAKGYTKEHDDEHADGELGQTAAFYASNFTASYWDVAEYPWKNPPSPSSDPNDRRADLIRAAALLVAEIERMDRLYRLDE